MNYMKKITDYCFSCIILEKHIPYHFLSVACFKLCSELLQFYHFPCLGYSVAVGEFTGDSQQGEKARSSLQQTTFSSRGIPH